MAWLEAILAFAITMMVLSTIVSAIVEAGQGLLNQRSKGLERLMEHMFDKVISPRLAGQLPADMTGSRFVKQMTDMRWVPIEINAPKWKKTYYGIVNKLRRTDKVQKLGTLEFLERVAESPVGAVLLDKSKKIGDENKTLGVFLEDLASKYEDFGDNASIYFARRARMYSVLVGFVLAFSINFSAIDVVKTLMQSESSRTALIEQGDAIADKLNEQLKQQAEESRQALEVPGDDQDGDTVTGAEFDTDKLEQTLNEGLRTLQEAQLPIGWQHAPWQAEKLNLAENEEETSWVKFKQWISWSGFVRWAGSVFLAGLLVGLGGPFWFNTYRRLSALTSVAKAFQSEVKQESQQGAQSSREPVGDERAKRFVRIFDTARTASDFAKAAGRQPLTNSGNTIQLGHIR